MSEPTPRTDACFKTPLELEVQRLTIELAALKRDYATDVIKFRETSLEIAMLKQGRELLHRKFGFVPHPDDPKRCACAYCSRDVEAIADHAAELEMSEHSLRQENDKLKASLSALQPARSV
jgi:hypothetical protein